MNGLPLVGFFASFANKCNRKDKLVQVPDKFILLVYNKRKEENEVC